MTKRKEEILIVEDDPTVKSILEAALEDSYTIYSTSSAEDALKLGKARNKPIDMAIIDFHLPGMNGLDFAQSTGIPFIITTVDMSSTSIDKWGESGAFGYLPKPIMEPKSIVHVVATALFNIRRQKRMEYLLQNRRSVLLATGLIMWRDGVTAEEAERILKTSCHQKQGTERSSLEDVSTALIAAHNVLCTIKP